MAKNSKWLDRWSRQKQKIFKRCIPILETCFSKSKAKMTTFDDMNSIEIKENGQFFYSGRVRRYANYIISVKVTVVGSQTVFF